MLTVGAYFAEKAKTGWYVIWELTVDSTKVEFFVKWTLHFNNYSICVSCTMKSASLSADGVQMTFVTSE